MRGEARYISHESERVADLLRTFVSNFVLQGCCPVFVPVCFPSSRCPIRVIRSFGGVGGGDATERGRRLLGSGGLYYKQQHSKLPLLFLLQLLALRLSAASTEYCTREKKSKKIACQSRPSFQFSAPILAAWCGALSLSRSSHLVESRMTAMLQL